MNSKWILVPVVLLCGCPDKASAPCGNGLIEAGEVCDGARLNDETCVSLGFGAGQLGCKDDCQAYDFSGCGVAASCGNDRIDSPEVCDGARLNDESCSTLGLGQGTLACLGNCAGYDTTGCGSQSCTKDCSGRVCGPDPVCGKSCGTCSAGTCNASGQCETASANAPTILTLQTNNSVVTPGSTLIVTTMVTDPDGIDDLIGGTLVDPTSDSSYGAFATSAQEGSYTLTLTWDAINTVKAITATAPAGTQRVLRAKFFDQQGHEATKDVTVTLTCGDSVSTPCSGACVNLQTDSSNCGSCGRNVTLANGRCLNGAEACQAGLALCNGACTSTEYSSNESCGACGHDCADVAAAISGSESQGCSEQKCHVDITVSSYASDCDAVCASHSLLCFGQGWSSNDALYRDPSTGSTQVYTVPCNSAPSDSIYVNAKQFDFVSLLCRCAE